MRIAVAQIRPHRGDIAKNIDLHKRFISLAAAQKAAAIFFPELSLTGYEPTLARELAIQQEDERLDDFQRLSDAYGLTIGLGAPIHTRAGVQIGMVIFQPGAARQTYAKQQLHADELPYFVPGDLQLLLTVGDKKIAPAICYESLQIDHAEHAHQLGADLYVAGVAKSQGGIDRARRHYPNVAQRFSLAVLMANCLGYCDNFAGVGQSAAWTRQGRLAGQLDGEREGLLVFDMETEEVFLQI